MKILFLSDGFPPAGGGGAEIAAFNLARELKELGHQVYVITTVRNKSEAAELDYQGLDVFKIYANYHERWRAYLSLYNPQTINQVEKIIKQIKPDIVHIHNVHYYLSYYCLKIAKKYSRAVFLTAHDTMLFHYGKLFEFVNFNDLSIPDKFNYKITPWQQIKRFKKRYNPFRNIIIRHYLKYVDTVFSVSDVLKEALAQNGIRDTVVIHNGVNIDNWQCVDSKIEDFKKKHSLVDKKIVSFVGRLSTLKGGEKAIKAMGKVVRRVPGAILLVIGKKDSYAKEMGSLANKANVPIVFTDWLDGDELIAAYYTSNVFLTPSIYLDPFNLINIEAMAAGKPVIGTCFGGTSEIVINDETGYIVNPFNIDEMTDKIVDLLNNFQKLEQFGQNGLKRIRDNFSLEKQITKTLRWYRKYIR